MGCSLSPFLRRITLLLACFAWFSLPTLFLLTSVHVLPAKAHCLLISFLALSNFPTPFAEHPKSLFPSQIALALFPLLLSAFLTYSAFLQSEFAPALASASRSLKLGLLPQTLYFEYL